MAGALPKSRANRFGFRSAVFRLDVLSLSTTIFVIRLVFCATSINLRNE